MVVFIAGTAAEHLGDQAQRRTWNSKGRATASKRLNEFTAALCYGNALFLWHDAPPALRSECLRSHQQKQHRRRYKRPFHKRCRNRRLRRYKRHAFPTHFRGKACFHRSASGYRFRAVTRDYGPGYTCLCLSRAPVSKRTSRCVVLSIEHCTLSKNLLCVLPRTAAIKNNSDGSRGLEATRRKWLAFRARSTSVVY